MHVDVYTFVDFDLHYKNIIKMNNKEQVSNILHSDKENELYNQTRIVTEDQNNVTL